MNVQMKLFTFWVNQVDAAAAHAGAFQGDFQSIARNLVDLQRGIRDFGQHRERHELPVATHQLLLSLSRLRNVAYDKLQFEDAGTFSRKHTAATLQIDPHPVLPTKTKFQVMDRFTAKQPFE